MVTGIDQHFVQILKNCLFHPNLLHFHVMQCYSLPVVVLQNTHHFSASQQNLQSIGSKVRKTGLCNSTSMLIFTNVVFPLEHIFFTLL